MTIPADSIVSSSTNEVKGSPMDVLGLKKSSSPEAGDTPMDTDQAPEFELHALGFLVAEVEHMAVGAAPRGGLGTVQHYEDQSNHVNTMNNNLRFLMKESPHTMNPALLTDIGLDEFIRNFTAYLGMIKNQTLQGHAPGEKKSRSLKKKGKGAYLETPDYDELHVNTLQGLSQMLHAIDEVKDQATTSPLLAIDIEGFDHTNDSISILQMCVPLLKKIYIVDTLILGRSAFSTPAIGLGSESSLRTILESTQIRKIFYDCRGDSESLYKICRVDLQGVEDCQLMDLATRNKGQRRNVNALEMALPQRLHMTPEDEEAWRSSKRWGKLYMTVGREEADRLYEKLQGNYVLIDEMLARKDCEVAKISNGDEDVIIIDAPSSLPLDMPVAFSPKEDENLMAGSPESASSGAVTQSSPTKTQAAISYKFCQEEFGRIDDRPIGHIMTKYCVGDVVLLHAMYQHFLEHRNWNETWAELCAVEVENRLRESKKEGLLQEKFGGEGLRAGPVGWNHLNSKGALLSEPVE